MLAGLSYGITTCALWALSFVSPAILQDFSPYAVTLGRYATFALVSLALVPFALRHIRSLRCVDWAKAAWLAVIGHAAYYLFLASAIQLAGVPAPTVIVGLLPLTVPLFANLHGRELPWRALALPLIAIGVGLMLVQSHELQRLDAEDNSRYVAGICLALAALACWTWYGIANARWLRLRQTLTSTGWTMAQGIALLPIVLLGTLALSAGELDPTLASATLQQWQRFWLVSLIVGLASTWLATLCWSQASRLLPTTIAGQLIAVVPIAAVAYGSAYRVAWPSLTVCAGVLILAASVALAVRSIQPSSSG